MGGLAVFRKRLLLLLPICVFLICCSFMYFFVTSMDSLSDAQASQDSKLHSAVKSRSRKEANKDDVGAHGGRDGLKEIGVDGLDERDKNKSREAGPIVKSAADVKKSEIPVVPRNVEDGKGSRRAESGPGAYDAKKDARELPKIPHIIHQIWDTADIQTYLEYWVKSWKTVHPDWQYWLWTLEDGHELLKRAFPSFLPLYEGYNEDIFRMDALRLFILYAFGGIYVDIDMYSIKRLDPWTYEHHCLLTQETYEHSFIVEEKNRTNVVNGFLACRPGHPFYRLAIESLISFAGEYFGDFLHATGPFFVDAIYQKYNRTVHAKDDSLAVVPPKYFLPTFDPTQEGVVSYKCAPSRYKHLSQEGQELCRALWRRDFANKVGPEAFTNHKWMHLYMYDPSWKTKNTKPLLEMVPKAHDVQDVLRRIDRPLWTD